MKTIVPQLVLIFSLSYIFPAFAETGAAMIKGTEENSPISGTVILEDVGGVGLRITATVEGVSPGKHGFHIHEYGSCEEGGKAAGGHYNPQGFPHGNVITKGFFGSHAGDLGNIEISKDGTGSLNVTIPPLSLSGGAFNLAGRAVVLHEKEDDFGQPTGNAGARIGCGTITIVADETE